MKYRYFIMLYIISGASEINIKINFIRVINGEMNYLLSNTIQKIHNKQTKKKDNYIIFENNEFILNELLEKLFFLD